MRWFKHLSHASDDPTIAMLMDEFGAEGYGVYWIILEKIARNLDENDQTFVTFSLKNWSNFTRTSPKRFQKIINFLADSENFSSKNPLFFLEFFQKNRQTYITIKCPKLLKYRDEYTKKRRKNSGQTPDNVRTNSGETPDNIRSDSGQTPEKLRTNSGHSDIYISESDTETEKEIKNIFIYHNHQSIDHLSKELERAKKIIQTFESISGKKINLNNAQTARLIVELSDFDDEIINKALKICEKRKPKSLKYLKAVIESQLQEQAQNVSDRW